MNEEELIDTAIQVLQRCTQQIEQESPVTNETLERASRAVRQVLMLLVMTSSIDPDSLSITFSPKLAGVAFAMRRKPSEVERVCTAMSLAHPDDHDRIIRQHAARWSSNSLLQGRLSPEQQITLLQEGIKVPDPPKRVEPADTMIRPANRQRTFEIE